MWGGYGIGRSKWRCGLLGLIRQRPSPSSTKTLVIASGLQFSAAVLGYQGGNVHSPLRATIKTIGRRKARVQHSVVVHASTRPRVRSAIHILVFEARKHEIRHENLLKTGDGVIRSMQR